MGSIKQKQLREHPGQFAALTKAQPAADLVEQTSNEARLFLA